jgi:hypothetical protein
MNREGVYVVTTKTNKPTVAEMRTQHAKPRVLATDGVVFEEREVLLSNLRTDPAALELTQWRHHGINLAHVLELVEVLRLHGEFADRVIVVEDDEGNGGLYVPDGSHRVEAYRTYYGQCADFEGVTVRVLLARDVHADAGGDDVLRGARLARKLSWAANAEHGKPLNQAEQRDKIKFFLKWHPEDVARLGSENAVAQFLGVGRAQLRAVLQQLMADGEIGRGIFERLKPNPAEADQIQAQEDALGRRLLEGMRQLEARRGNGGGGGDGDADGEGWGSRQPTQKQLQARAKRRAQADALCLDYIAKTDGGRYRQIAGLLGKLHGGAKVWGAIRLMAERQPAAYRGIWEPGRLHSLFPADPNYDRITKDPEDRMAVKCGRDELPPDVMDDPAAF